MKTCLRIWLLLPLFLLGACNMQIVRPDDPTQPSNPTAREDTASLRPDQRRNPAWLYDLEAMPEVTITLTRSDWDRYLANFDANPNNGLYVPARFRFSKNGEVYERDSVGLRPRGNTSRRRPEGQAGEMHNPQRADWHHAHFGVRFTEYDSGERFFGSDRIILKWFNNDPSYCRELFCYDLFRRFGVWTAPRASYCRLWLQIEGDSKPSNFGVYELIEGVRKGWLSDRRKDGLLCDHDGNLWKAAYNGCGIADLSDFSSTRFRKMGIADEEHDWSYALKTNKQTGLAAAQQELYDFMEQMRPLPSGSAELKAYIEQHMDVTLFIRALAVNVAVGMWDDYWVNGNNYYFYFDTQHRFYFIPFDYDNTLGTSQSIGPLQNAGTQDPLHWGSRDGDRLLVKKVLSIAEYETAYKNCLRELVNSSDLMEPEAAMARIRRMQAMVEPYVDNDTGEDGEVADRPAGWSNIDYRLLSGDDGGGDGSNFFRTKARSVELLNN